MEDSAQSGNYSELHPKLLSQVYPLRTDVSKPVFTVPSSTAVRPVTQRWLEGFTRYCAGVQWNTYQPVKEGTPISDTSFVITEPQRHKSSASERIQSQTYKGSILRYLESHRHAGVAY